MTEAFDDPAQRGVVIGDTGARGSLVQPYAKGVIARQPDHLQAWHVAFTLEPLEFLQETVRPFRVRIFQVEATIFFVDMSAQGFHARHCRVVRRFTVGNEFAITTVAQAGVCGAVPEITTSGRGHGNNSFGGVYILLPFVVAILEWPGLF